MFNLSAVLCAFLMLDTLAEIPSRAWKRYEQSFLLPMNEKGEHRDPSIFHNPDRTLSESELLIRYGSDKRWTITMKSTGFFAGAGALMVFLQVSTFRLSRSCPLTNAFAADRMGLHVRNEDCGRFHDNIRHSLAHSDGDVGLRQHT